MKYDLNPKKKILYRHSTEKIQQRYSNTVTEEVINWSRKPNPSSSVSKITTTPEDAQLVLKSAQSFQPTDVVLHSHPVSYPEEEFNMMRVPTV